MDLFIQAAERGDLMDDLMISVLSFLAGIGARDVLSYLHNRRKESRRHRDYFSKIFE